MGMLPLSPADRDISHQELDPLHCVKSAIRQSGALAVGYGSPLNR